MNSLHDLPQPPSELEALIHAAQNFVEPSDDLRPRVLEAAREERKQLYTRQRLGKAAALVIALGMFLAMIRQELQSQSPDFAGPSRSASPLAISPTAALSPNDSAWEMVESLTELRKRQALLFRLSL